MQHTHSTTKCVHIAKLKAEAGEWEEHVPEMLESQEDLKQ